MIQQFMQIKLVTIDDVMVVEQSDYRKKGDTGNFCLPSGRLVERLGRVQVTVLKTRIDARLESDWAR